MAATKDWDRLAEFTRERRVDLGMTQEDAAAAGGPSSATMRLIEGALQQGYRPSTLRDLEKVLRWERGSVARILAGSYPVVADDGPPSIPAADEPVEPALMPFLEGVWAAEDAARAKYGPDPAPEQIFSTPWEIELWRSVNLPLRAKRRTIAQIRKAEADADAELGRRAVLLSLAGHDPLTGSDLRCETSTNGITISSAPAREREIRARRWYWMATTSPVGDT